MNCAWFLRSARVPFIARRGQLTQRRVSFSNRQPASGTNGWTLQQSHRPRQEGGKRSRSWPGRQRIAQVRVDDCAQRLLIVRPNSVRTACTGCEGSLDCRLRFWSQPSPISRVCRAAFAVLTCSPRAGPFNDVGVVIRYCRRGRRCLVLPSVCTSLAPCCCPAAAIAHLQRVSSSYGYPSRFAQQPTSRNTSAMSQVTNWHPGYPMCPFL